jgi:hypothetical protein
LKPCAACGQDINKLSEWYIVLKVSKYGHNMKCGTRTCSLDCLEVAARDAIFKEEMENR